MIVEVSQSFQECSVLKDAVCVFGVFDGVHQGHRYVIEQAKNHAVEQGKSFVVISFAKDPDEIFNAAGLKKLMSNKRRLEVLDRIGANCVLALPSTTEFFGLTPQEFLEKVFQKNTPFAVHVGKDFRFGKGAQGTFEDLSVWGQFHHMQVVGYNLFEVENLPVTASRIRQLLADCRIREANVLLCNNFTLEGVVEVGRQEGRDMGFRTANVTIPSQLYALGEGVYGAYAVTEEGKRYKAAVSVGGAPTFGEAAHANVEAHILDFDQDIYGQTLRLEFVEFLRPMMIFDSLEVLIQTVMGNIQWCKDNL